MKFEIKKAARPAIIIAGLLAVAGTAVSHVQPAWAGKALSAALIDPDLEQALKKHFEKRFFNLIDASEDQKTKLDGLITKQIDSARPLRQQVRENVIDLADMMADSSVSDDAIRKKVDEIQTIRDQIHEKRVNTFLEARAVLTADQKKIVATRLKGFLTGNPGLGLRSD